MTKVLRKYRTWLLAIFGSFLMVSFLLTGPSSVFMPDPMKQVEGTLLGEKVRVKDGMHAAAELEAVSAIAGSLVKNQLQIDGGIHWLMLTREAERAGLVGGEADGRESLTDIARSMVPLVVRDRTIQDLRQNQPQMFELVRRNPDFLNFFVQQDLQRLTENDIDSIASQINQEMVQSIPSAAGRARLSVPETEVALAKLRGVVRLQNGYLAAARLSDRRYVNAARGSSDQVVADAVAIPGIVLADPAFAPTAEQITAQFEQYKSIRPGEGEAGIGYLQPERVKVEWIEVSRASIDSTVTVDLKDVSKHWQQNRTRFPGELEAERANVEAELKQARVDIAMGEVDRAWKNRVSADLRRIQTIQGVRQLPADWETTRTPLATYASAMAEAVKTTTKIEMPVPTVQSRTSTWNRLSELANAPGIGRAEHDAGSRSYSFTNLLMNTYELSGDATLGLQVGAPFEGALVDDQGHRFYFVVTGARKPSPPDSVDDVRDQVVRHLREKAGYEAGMARLAEFQAKAAGEGLDALVTELNAAIADPSVSRLSVARNLNFTREQADSRLGLVKAEGVRDEIIRIAEVLGPLTAASSENIALRTGGAGSAVDRAVVVFQVNGMRPFTQEALRSRPANVATRLAVAEMSKLSATSDAADAFSPDAVAKRLDWKPAGTPRKQDEPSTEAKVTPAASPAK